MSIVEIENTRIVVVEVEECPIKPISYKEDTLSKGKVLTYIMSVDEIANKYLKTKNSSWEHYTAPPTHIILMTSA